MAQKPPQERATPKNFEHVLPYVRAEAGADGVSFSVRYERQSRYSGGFTLEGRDGVKELHDYLTAWLAADEQSRGSER